MRLKPIVSIKDVEEVKNFFHDVFPEEPKYDCKEFMDSVTGKHKYKG